MPTDEIKITGYAGYVPAKLPPPKPSSVQAQLWEIKNPASLEVIAKLLRNVVVQPSEEKFRRIRLSNAKIHSLVREERGALETLLAMGWIVDPEDKDEDMLILPKGVQFSMNEVRPSKQMGTT